MAAKVVPLYTIGYEGRTVKDLLAVLKQAKVERVVDVRQLPLSRKPGAISTRAGHELCAG